MNHNFGVPWTPSEDLLLIDLAMKKINRHEIARIIGRPVSGVQARANRVGVPLDRRKWIRPPRPSDVSKWTEADRLAVWADIPQELAELVVKTCHRRGFEVKRLRSDTRSIEYVKCRWNIAFAARALGYSYPVIGRALNRDHTTIMHAIKSSTGARQGNVFRKKNPVDGFPICSSERDRIAA